MELHDPPSSGFHSKPARAILVFAVIDLIRLLRELLESWRDANVTYVRIMALDMILAALAMAAAIALMKQVPWGRPLAASVAAASLVPAIAFGCFLLPEVIAFWQVWRSNGDSHYLKMLFPRPIFDAIKIAFWPYLFWLIRREAVRVNAERRIWISSALSLLVSAVLVGTIFLLH